MVARHFMDEKTLLACLQKNPDFTEEEARALVGVSARKPSSSSSTSVLVSLWALCGLIPMRLDALWSSRNVMVLCRPW
jgi:uncharacterized protein YneF (UPF0154 family)